MQRYEYPTIREMEENMPVEGFYLMKSASVKTSNGKDRLTGKLADMSGEVDFVIWDYKDTIHTTAIGAPVKIRGTVSSYNNSLQVTVAMIREVNAKDAVDLKRLVPQAPIDLPFAFEQVQHMINKEIEDEDYRNLCLAMLQKHANKFAQLPAGKAVHHAFVGGMLMHTWMMMDHANYLAGLYNQVINKSLLLAATFCHDLNKDREFEVSPMGIVTDYSTDGFLLGHSYMGALEVYNVGKELGMPEEKLTLIQHCLLSHHGKPEFGAAVVPQCAEADLLNLIDLTDAHMEIFRETFDKIEPGTFSDRNFALDRKIYRHE